MEQKFVNNYLPIGYTYSLEVLGPLCLPININLFTTVQ